MVLLFAVVAYGYSTDCLNGLWLTLRRPKRTGILIFVRSLFAIALLGLFIGGLVLDAADTDCANQQTCCACVCATPLIPHQSTAALLKIPLVQHRFVTAEPAKKAQLFAKAVFHPPRITA